LILLSFCTHQFFFFPSLPAPSGKQWVKTAHLADHRDSVQDVKFAPRHLGLKIVIFPFFCFSLLSLFCASLSLCN
jgi:hypothetical protein